MRETNTNTLLGGQVLMHQPVRGYRAGMDAVMLAASLSARPGEHVVEFGCGPGAALLCAARRLGGVRFTAWEVEEWAAELARRNLAENGLADRAEVHCGDIADLPAEPFASQVFFNPPFFDDPDALRHPEPEKQRAWLSGETPLPLWVKMAARIIKGQGYLTIIHRADALPAILSATERAFGSVLIKPIQPRPDRPAKRVIVRVRRGGRSPATLLPPLVLHDATDRQYSEEAQAIMAGAPLVLD